MYVRFRSGTDQKIKPFDWTFITDYKGTLLDGLELTSTPEKINMELLMKREKILFYEDISLYEDELHDHGVASCSVKIVRNWSFNLTYINVR